MAKKNYQLDINGAIGWPISKDFVRNELEPYKNKEVNVRINSLGGSLNDGLDIRQQFIDHGDVTAYIYGFTASAATIIAMGAKKVCMSKHAMFLVHKVSNIVFSWDNMNADQIRNYILKLEDNAKANDKLDEVIASIYANKCKKKICEIKEILKNGKWITAEEALSFGFIDEIIEEGENYQNQHNINQIINAAGLPIPFEMKNKQETNLINAVVDKVIKLMKKNKKNMKFEHINKTIGEKSLDEKDDQIYLNFEQAEKINEKLKDYENLKEEIKSLKEKIELIEKSDGADDVKTLKTDNEKNDHDKEMYDFYKQYKNF